MNDEKQVEQQKLPQITAHSNYYTNHQTVNEYKSNLPWLPSYYAINYVDVGISCDSRSSGILRCID